MNVISAIIYDCRNSFKNLKTYEQRINFFNPANIQSSSEEFLKEKCHESIGMCD